MDALPDALDTTADQTPPYDGRHATVESGQGLRAGGDVNMRGDKLAGFALDTVSITTSTTINLLNWNAFQGRFVSVNSASLVTITIDDTPVDGTAQGGTIRTIVLDATDTAVDGAYDWMTIEITSGTGSGQSRDIEKYVASGKTATISTDWTTTPDATSVYQIKPRGNLPMAVKRQGAGGVAFAVAGNLTMEAVTTSISVRYGWASVVADANDQTVSVSAA